MDGSNVLRFAVGEVAEIDQSIGPFGGGELAAWSVLKISGTRAMAINHHNQSLTPGPNFGVRLTASESPQSF
jgi:hypothetical protein